MKDLIQWDGVHAIRNICNKASDPNRATLYTGTQGAGLCRQRRTEEQNVSSFQPYTPRQAIQPSNTYTRDSGALLPFRDIRLVRITCVPEHGTGWSNPLSSSSTGARFPGGNSVFFEVTVCSAGLTPFWICHN